MTDEIPFEVDMAHRRCVVGGEPTVFHCHHYNAFLQQSLQDAGFLDMYVVQLAAAESVAFTQLGELFQHAELSSPHDRLSFVERYFAWAGFGRVELSGLSESGGEVQCPSSHYAVGFRARRGADVDAPVCVFVCGFIAGAVAAAFDRPLGSFDVEETRCAAVTPGACAFRVASRATPRELTYPAPGVGPLTHHQPRDIPATPVDYDGILAAVSGLPLVGNEDGLILAFGVILTRHYANYYNHISFEFLRQTTERFGDEGHDAAYELLVEAGRVCAFNTFGGIMVSTEWDALIRPTLVSREDWVHGIVAVVNALGWGRWQVTDVSAEGATFVIHDDYESIGWLAMYGPADAPITCLHEGGVVGVMNLVYIADIASRPDLDAALYERVFVDEGAYRVASIKSAAQGGGVTEIRVVPGKV